MDKQFAIQTPVHNLSFGDVGFNLLYTLYKKNPKKDYPIFVIGDKVDFSGYKVEQGFGAWLSKNIGSAQHVHSRKNLTFKNWHIVGSLESFSEEQVLLTYHECDTLTPKEVNILKNQKKVLVTSKYSKRIFEDYGLKNVTHCPLGFDSLHYFDTKKQYFTDGRINFLLAGKMEINRKHTFKTLRAWVKKYGNSHKYFLNCSINNPFLPIEQQNALIGQALEGQRYWNVNFLPFVPTKAEYNDILNVSDVVLGTQGAESWNIPLFTALALGKHAVVLNAHVHSDYCNEENSVLLSPSGKIPVYDNIFFKQGLDHNQGSVYTFDDAEFISACEVAVQRVEKNRVNEAGLKLQDEYTYEKTIDTIIQEINE